MSWPKLDGCIISHFGDTYNSVEDYLGKVDRYVSAGRREYAIDMLESLYQLAVEHDVRGLSAECRRRIDQLTTRLEVRQYNAGGAADPINRPPEKADPVKQAMSCHIRLHCDGVPNYSKSLLLEKLVTQLSVARSEKDMARIALLIFESPVFIDDYNRKFRFWYRDFCKIVGCKYHESYHPSALKPISERLQAEFDFLKP